MQEAFNNSLPPVPSAPAAFTCRLADALWTADLSHFNSYEIKGIEDKTTEAAYLLDLELANEEIVTVEDREVSVSADGYAEFTIDDNLHRFRFQSYQPMQHSQVLAYRPVVEGQALISPGVQEVQAQSRTTREPIAGSFNRGAPTQLGGVYDRFTYPHRRLALNLPESLDLK